MPADTQRTQRLVRGARVLAALLALAAGGVAVLAPSASAATTTVTAGQSVQAAVRAAASGDTLLLLGSFTEDVTIETSGITLTSAPGQVATLQGRLIVWDGANDVVVSNLRLDGRNAAGAPSPTVLGDRAVFRSNDVTNENTEICFILGSMTRGYAAEGTVIDGNRIHNCGKLPAENGDHGIYVEYARGTVITRNAIYDNADRGIQLYPDADDSLIEGNIIDGNGEGIIFSGSGSATSDRNVVRGNIITNSRIRYNVEYYYGSSAAGVGNVVTGNCLWGGAQGNIIGDGVAFTASRNVVADPLYASRASKDYRLQDSSPCGSLMGAQLGGAEIVSTASGGSAPAESAQGIDLFGTLSGSRLTVGASGQGTAANVAVRLELVGSRGVVVAAKQLTIQSLVAGTSAPVSPRLVPSRGLRLRAVIDPARRIAETNEANNVVG